MSRRPPRRSTARIVQSDASRPEQEHPAVQTPRARLLLAAAGKQQLTGDELVGLLADHVIDADGHAQRLRGHGELLLRMVVEDGQKKKGTPDLIAALDAVGKLDALQRSSMAELRKTIELLWRMSGPTRPRVEVLDAKAKRAESSR